jgi:hypothetical protein
MGWGWKFYVDAMEKYKLPSPITTKPSTAPTVTPGDSTTRPDTTPKA